MYVGFVIALYCILCLCLIVIVLHCIMCLRLLLCYNILCAHHVCRICYCIVLYFVPFLDCYCIVLHSVLCALVKLLFPIEARPVKRIHCDQCNAPSFSNKGLKMHSKGPHFAQLVVSSLNLGIGKDD